MGTLLVAATGGHLKQLHMLQKSLAELGGEHEWVTFDKEQSRSLLAGEDDSSIHFVRFIGSRDLGNTLRGLVEARRIVRTSRPETVVSTGNAIALPYMVLGRLRGARCIYIESAARSAGPSLTGQMLMRVPGVELRTQYETWASGRWSYQGSVFDTFVARERPPRPVRKVVVTLGTLKYDFSRLVDQIMAVVPDDAEVIWQIGASQLKGVRGVTHSYMPGAALDAAMREADVVIGHAGVGSALGALEAGRAPILVPRRAAYGEHVDDHQEQIARELARRGLAVAVEADALTPEHLAAAAARTVVRRPVDRGAPMRRSGRFRRRRVQSLR